MLTLACGDTSGTLPQGQPFDAIAGFSGSPTMNPGADCLSCHSSTGLASYRPWTLAGTVYPSVTADAGLGGAQLLVTDVNGTRLTLESNAAGNFYTAEPLGDLTDVEVQSGGHRMVMDLAIVGTGSLQIIGSCNRCHQDAASSGPALGIGGAPGRLFVPAP